LLDEYASHAPSEQRTTLAAHEAALRWAAARSWIHQFELSPTDTTARDEAACLLDQIITDLRSAIRDARTAPADVRDESRYRLARALADRAELQAEDGPATKAIQDEALQLLDPPLESSLFRAYGSLLNASLLRQAGRPADALRAIDEALASDPPPPLDESLPVQVRILADLGRFDEAEALLARPQIDPRTRHLARLDLLLTRLERERDEALQALACAEADELAGTDRRLARIRLARTVRDPAPSLAPSGLAALAEGLLALGRPDDAAGRLTEGAERAGQLGDRRLAAELRYQAAGTLIEAGEPDRAVPLLTALRDDPNAGDLRPRAGMLLALSVPRGDAAAATDALRAVIRDFPDDPLANEARLRLGSLHAARGERDAAEDAWRPIPPDHPAWLASRRAWFESRMGALEAMSHPTEAEIQRHVGEITRFLDAFQAEAPDTAGRVEAGLARVRFNLSDPVDRPAAAAETLDRLDSLPLRADQRTRLRGWRTALDLRQGRYPEAERRVPELLRDGDRASLRTVARFLGRMALRGKTDLQQRRTGSILQAILDHLRQQGETASEIDLLEARARIARGDAPSALPGLRRLQSELPRLPDDLLTELSETWREADDPAAARTALAELVRRQPPGSVPWFEAQYRLARMMADTDQVREALRLLEGTALLHPDLGGEGLNARFERLQRELAREGRAGSRPR
jgi:tetratricopeptide (TPR) repeat protein